MKCAALTVLAAVAVLLTADGVSAAARQRPQPQPSEEARRAAEEQAEREMKAVEEAEAQWRAETEKAFQETRQQRADFDKKMEDFADAHSKDAGTRVTYVMRVGDDGLPEGGEVWFVNRGFITHRAEFDADGNTEGLFITPDGRARQNILAHRPPPGVPVNSRYLFTNGPDGRTQISDVVWSAEDGSRGHMKFNLDGNAYFGEFWGTDGQRSGGFYDASLEPREAPPRALTVPPVPRLSTQPCEPCREIHNQYNDLVARMAPLQREMADLARANGKTGPGRARTAIEQRYDALKAEWDANAPQLEALLAKLRACAEQCYRPSQTTSLASLPGACTGPSCPSSCSIGETCTDFASFSDCQGCAQIGGTSPGDRDQSVQYMIIEIVALRAAELMTSPPSIARAARTLWDTLRGVLGGASYHAARNGAYPLAGRAQRPSHFAQANRQTASTGSGVTTLLTSLGTATGEAFEIQVANDGKMPLNLNGNGVIVEPLKPAVARQSKRAVSQLASRKPVTQRLDAYCVEMLKQPPSPGTIFRVASPEIQKRFAPMRGVLQASYRLQQAGVLKPDSDPKAYFAALKQWALWSRERNFNEKTYGDAFVEHTKKGAAERGVKWTSQIEAGIRSLVPHRWSDISRILQAAQ